jgi:hypothetical protein
MREKVIGYSIACCLVLGVIFIKNKVFLKRFNKDEEDKKNAGLDEKSPV